MWLFNPAEPTAAPLFGGNPLIGQPGSPCGSCPLAPPFWQLTCGAVSAPYQKMGGTFVLSRDLAPIDITRTVNAIFTGSGSANFIVPNTVPASSTALLELWGDGGAGGSSGNGSNGGGGGGGGGYSSANVTINPGQSIAFACGLGGAATSLSDTNGSAGTGSTCSIFSLTAGAGQGGQTDGGPGGAGGAGTIAGSAGSSFSGIDGGAGGSVYLGGAGGLGGVGNLPGNAGTAPGAGGGGAGKHSFVSGAGAAGQIRLTYPTTIVVAALNTQQLCAWKAAITLNTSPLIQGFWRLYWGGYAPNTGGAGISGWIAVADMHENAPNDIDGWGPNAIAANPPTPNWSTTNWNCLSSNIMQSADGGLGLPSTIQLQPFWP